jgi:hypothetical protein
MITGDPFMMILALVSLLFAVAAHADNDRWQLGYFGCFIVSIVGAYVVPT